MPLRTCPCCDGTGVVKSRAPLTAREYAALRYILAFRVAHGVSPTYRELASGIGARSQATAFEHVEGLRKKGYVRIKPRSERSIEVF